MIPVVRGLAALAAALCVLAHPAGARAGETGSTAPFYFGPRIGPSMVTGYLGLEAQYRHVALGGGLLFDDGWAAGVKYFFSRDPSSIYVFGSYLHVDTEGGGDGDGQESSSRRITNIGVGIGWQKRWQSGVSVSLGLGPSYYEDNEIDSHVMFVLDLSLGYAFAFGKPD